MYKLKSNSKVICKCTRTAYGINLANNLSSKRILSSKLNKIYIIIGVYTQNRNRDRFDSVAVETREWSGNPECLNTNKVYPETAEFLARLHWNLSRVGTKGILSRLTSYITHMTHEIRMWSYNGGRIKIQNVLLSKQNR